MPILKPTSAVMIELLEAINNAEAEILLQIFYIDDDAITAQFVEALIHKSLEGVRVYCLVDALGAKNFAAQTIEQRLKDAGVHIEYFNWLTPWSGRSKKLWYFRNHKRSLIIDNKTVHLGGWCIGDKTSEWIEGHIKNNDIDVVRDAVEDFWNMYKYAHKTQFQFSNQKKYKYTNKTFSYTNQSPLLRARYTYYSHKRLTQNADKRIVLVTPYFAPLHGLLKQLRNAQKRGVQVDIFLPKKTDHFFVDLVAKTYMYNLLRIGVNVYVSDTMIHAKACLFDNVLYVGTMNLDTISLRYNFENGIYVKDAETIQEFENDIAILKSSCTQLTFEEWRKRGFWARFLDKFMKLLRPFV